MGNIQICGTFLAFAISTEKVYGTKVEADVVVLGTGYDGDKKLKTFLPSEFGDAFDESGVALSLYRYGEKIKSLYTGMEKNFN